MRYRILDGREKEPYRAFPHVFESPTEKQALARFDRYVDELPLQQAPDYHECDVDLTKPYVFTLLRMDGMEFVPVTSRTRML